MRTADFPICVECSEVNVVCGELLNTSGTCELRSFLAVVSVLKSRGFVGRGSGRNEGGRCELRSAITGMSVQKSMGLVERGGY